MSRSFPSRARRSRRAAFAAVTLAALACPAAADAHGIGGGSSLPIPAWLFAWAATLVLVVSFVGLAVLWPTPRLAKSGQRRLATLPPWLEWLAGGFGVAAFAAVVYAGFAGTQDPDENILPTFVFVAFWVGVPLASVVLGDVFRPLNPWRAVARAVVAVTRRVAPALARRTPAAYPQRLGVWPAAAGLVGFAWLELVYVNRDDPSILAWLTLAYAAVQLAGMAVYGIETWTRRADAFSVYFSLLSRLAPLTVSQRTLIGRMPLAGLPSIELVPGIVALLCVMLGTTTFDGLSGGAAWAQLAPGITGRFADLGLGAAAASQAARTVGLLASLGLVAGLYLLCVRGMRSVAPEQHETQELADRFVHTLVPVAFGYVIAHYFVLLLAGSQSLGHLVSDPLGSGANLLGTAHWGVDTTLLSAGVIWCVQVAVLVGGHVGGLILSHERALLDFPVQRQAVRSQYWALCVMIGFTSLGLWLLSTANVR
jgi:hypothetical protein